AGAGNAVSGFAAFADGSLALLPGSPWSTEGRGPSGQAFVAAPSIAVGGAGRHLFVLNSGSDSLAAFVVGDDGALMEVPGSPFPTGGVRPEGIATTRDGRTLFVGHAGAGTIVSHVLDASGHPAPVGAFGVGSAPDGMATTPDGRFLLATLPALGRVAVLRIDDDGRLAPAPGSPFETDAGTADGVALGRAGALVYVADALPAALEVSLYTMSPEGALRSTPGSPFGGAGGTANILHLLPGGSLLAATLAGSNRIAGFAIGPEGRLSEVPGSPFP